MADEAVEIASNVATQLIKESLSNLYSPISELLTVKRAQFIEEFSSYCTNVHNKSSMVRTLYSKNKPMALEDVYVKTNFFQDSETFTEDSLLIKFAEGERIIVKGNGGSGKTIFLKSLWLSRFKNTEGRIPIFVELRRLNDLQSIDITAFCRSELQSDMSFGKGVFEKLCEAGKFEFIFDGFDEVSRDNRKIVEQQILSLSDKYKMCCFLVSGRSDDRFSSWSSFQSFSVSPLSLSDVRELIDKIPFDRKVKKKFLSTLDKDFYERHESFLSSPLLACMMLMTFNENAIIPSKLTEFYKSAFQTLLTWHDATKDSFERDRSLPIDEFRLVFSTFCLISYYDQAYEFDEDLLRNYINKSLQYHALKKDVDDVKNDMCESANLLQKDGLKFYFVHRSFQEFFAAECAMQVISGKAEDFLEVFAKRGQDTVFSMCYEIHPELVFDQFFSKNLLWLRQQGYLIEENDNFELAKWVFNLIRMQAIGAKKRLHLYSLQYELSDKTLQRAERLCELCLQTQNVFHYDLSHIHFIFGRELTKINKDFRTENSSEDIVIEISINLREHPPKVSLRNIGEEKLVTAEMNKFRAALKKALNLSFKNFKDRIRTYHAEVLLAVNKLENERQIKEKSIDEILNLNS